MVMLIRILVSTLVTPVLSEQSCALKTLAVDDATSLFQSHAHLKPSAAEEKSLSANIETGNAPIKEAKTLSDRHWLGADLNIGEGDEEYARIRAGLKERRGMDYALTEGSYAAQSVVGMFGSGTNLMRTFIDVNFGRNWEFTSTVEEKPPGMCMPRPYHQASQVPCPLFWKHTHPFRIEYFDDVPSRARPTALIAMVRNPFSQLADWLRTPFCLLSCSLESPCTCNEQFAGGQRCWDGCFPCGRNLTDDMTMRFGKPLLRTASAGDRSYSSMVSVWNEYTTSYLALARQQIPMKVIPVRYEDVVLKPDETLHRLSSELGIKSLHDTAQIIKQNQRGFDPHSKGRAQALQYMKDKAYLKKFTPEQRQIICSQVDAEVMAHFGYGDDCRSWMHIYQEAEKVMQST